VGHGGCLQQKKQPLLLQAANDFGNPTIHDVLITLKIFPQFFTNTSLPYMFEQWTLTAQGQQQGNGSNTNIPINNQLTDFWRQPPNDLKLKDIILTVLDHNEGQPVELWHIYKSVQYITWNTKHAVNPDLYPATPNQTTIRDVLDNMQDSIFKHHQNGTDFFTSRRHESLLTTANESTNLLWAPEDHKVVIEVEDYTQMTQQ